ncbi:bile acid:sodium symporter family protein [Xanthobacter agilis]|jgi:sodium/bile acid cotransporter 7|uniref:Sodium/bile acid cotransporter 7 n=1 Tax=Xanthobacter agilis TaxID=47492 RepID=A0ABU0LCI8_XANAG|nr:bile acid:sodium symporter family protein [Xanthobacter agilis]MDQ0504845.1 sodium/bile acid cotransporter 7 [Xanthobacter agilis]
MSARIKIDPFLPALVVVVVLALIWPQPGVTGGILHADRAATWGIGVIFFLYGISLATRRLLESATRWQLHLVVQLATFGLFPLVVVLAMPVLSRLMPEDVGIGFFFLAALPSTVSSSVAMTSLAKGNVAVAIFNASVSSLIGVFVTPLLMAWYLHATGGSMALGDVILKLVIIVILPLVAGQLVRPLLLSVVEKHKVIVKVADRAVILAIVYNAFCDSVAAGVWSGQSPTLLIEMIAGVGLLFAVVYVLIALFCRLVGFNHADTTAVLFCGSKKSLATGLPIAKVMFGTSPQLSLIITPIMIYHFLQLVVIGFIAGHRAAKGEVLEAIAEDEAAEPSLVAAQPPQKSDDA